MAKMIRFKLPRGAFVPGGLTYLGDDWFCVTEHAIRMGMASGVPVVIESSRVAADGPAEARIRADFVDDDRGDMERCVSFVDVYSSTGEEITGDKGRVRWDKVFSKETLAEMADFLGLPTRREGAWSQPEEKPGEKGWYEREANDGFIAFQFWTGIDWGLGIQSYENGFVPVPADKRVDLYRARWRLAGAA